MEVLIETILLSALLKYCLKAACNSGLKAMSGYAVFALLFPFALYPILINLPVNIVSELLMDRGAAEDFAVIVTVEAVTGIMLSLRLLDNYFKPKKRRSRFLGALKVLPGILSLTGIAYYELMFFRLRAGSPFLSTVTIYAVAVASAVLAMSFLIKRALPGESVKLELKMLLNLLILAVALSVNFTVSDYPVSGVSSPVDLWASAAVAAVFLAFAGAGFLAEKYGFTFSRYLLPHKLQSSNVNQVNSFR